MRTRLATLFDRFSRFGAWIAVAGTFLLVGGLAWDVSIHEASPGLAAHESVFTIDNPAHVVFLTGIGLIVVGMLGFLGGQVRAARSTRRARFISVTAVAIALALTAAVGAASAVQTQFSSASPGATAAHAHGAAGAVAHHATFVTSGPGCEPQGTPATAAQQDAATQLVAAVKARWSPALTPAVAGALGYLPPKVPGTDPILVHYGNRSLARATTDLMDPATPQALVYLHLPDGATVLGGVLFTAPIGSGPCPGGALTLWHYHQAAATREMIHVWLFDNPGGSFATGIGGTSGIRVAERELEAPAPVSPASPAPAPVAPVSPAPASPAPAPVAPGSPAPASPAPAG
jgi:hypothetical protein